MQPTHAGWYWDPAGRPGLFRWWDGVEWTRHISTDRNDLPPEPFKVAEPDSDGMLWAGGFAYPALPEPWRQCPVYPGFSDAIAQERRVGRTGRGEYDALIVIGSVPDRLREGNVQAIAESLSAEILAAFYPAERPAGPPVGQLAELGGHAAWRIDVQFDVIDESLEFAREDLLLVVADLPIGPHVLYASLPAVDGVPSVADVIEQVHTA